MDVITLYLYLIQDGLDCSTSSFNAAGAAPGTGENPGAVGGPGSSGPRSPYGPGSKSPGSLVGPGSIWGPGNKAHTASSLPRRLKVDYLGVLLQRGEEIEYGYQIRPI